MKKGEENEKVGERMGEKKEKRGKQQLIRWRKEWRKRY